MSIGSIILTLLFCAVVIYMTIAWYGHFWPFPPIEQENDGDQDSSSKTDGEHTHKEDSETHGGQHSSS